MPYVNFTATRELISAHQPVELVANGVFSSDTAWTKGTGWTISGGVASAAAGSASDLEQDFSISSGLNYDLIFTVSNRTAGTITPEVGENASNSVNANGTHNVTVNAGVGAIALKFGKDSSFDGDIDNVSLMLGTNNYNWDFSVSSIRPNKHTPKSTHRALDGTPETFADDIQKSYTVSTKLIVFGSSDWLAWMEFLNSVREGEHFTFDPYGSSSIPEAAETYMIDGDWQELHVEQSFYRITFKVTTV